MERRCADFINRHLAEPLRQSDLEFRTWKRCADIGDIDVYGRVAQGLKQRELTLCGSNLLYHIRVPEYEGQRYGELWTVHLVGDQVNNFLGKYGENYEVRLLHS